MLRSWCERHNEPLIDQYRSSCFSCDKSEELNLLDIAFVEQQIKNQIVAATRMREDALQFDDNPSQVSSNHAFHDGGVDYLERLLAFFEDYIEIRKGEQG